MSEEKKLRKEFIQAIQDKNADVVKKFISSDMFNKPDVLKKIYTATTSECLLPFAVRVSSPEIVDMLLKAGFDPNEASCSRDKDGKRVEKYYTTLALAIHYDRPEMTEILLNDERTRLDFTDYGRYNTEPNAIELARQLGRERHIEIIERTKAERFFADFEKYSKILGRDMVEKVSAKPVPSKSKDAGGFQL